jgi:hypothetical protein
MLQEVDLPCGFENCRCKRVACVMRQLPSASAPDFMAALDCMDRSCADRINNSKGAYAGTVTTASMESDLPGSIGAAHGHEPPADDNIKRDHAPGGRHCRIQEIVHYLGIACCGLASVSETLPALSCQCLQSVVWPGMLGQQHVSEALRACYDLVTEGKAPWACLVVQGQRCACAALLAASSCRGCDARSDSSVAVSTDSTAVVLLLPSGHVLMFILRGSSYFSKASLV